MPEKIDILTSEAIELLKKLIATPSFSKQEDDTLLLLQQYLRRYVADIKTVGNNVWVVNKYFDASKPTLLLNSHHDTVKPNPGYTLDPFTPVEKDGKLFGLGSNDAGASLVSLLAAFLYFYEQEEMAYNLIFAASAEEEISGFGGVELLLPELGSIDCAIVGEPTQMQMAIAEKGLLVIDCVAPGRAGHAAREEGENAVYNAVDDIAWFRNYRFEKVSDLLGPVKMTVTIINAGSQHNVVPDACNFTVDIRLNELYTHEEVLEVIQNHVRSKVTPRSLRIRSSGIALTHPLTKAGLALGRSYYGSPTTSDKALMTFPSLKMGPGDSARSHTADEFIYLDEIREGVRLYVGLLKGVVS
jgi:acetylornithine deacetylase